MGLAGSGMLAISGLAAGALPVGAPAWWGDWRPFSLPALLSGYFGLTLMLVAWWWSGRARERDQRTDLVTFVLWCLPLAVAPPLFSRDVYSYLAQGAMVSASLDVYGDGGVSSLGGRLAAQVAPMWQDTPTPYGPVFVAISALVVAVAGTKLTLGVIGMRLAALAGVALLAVFVPRLAARLGVDPRAALWLGVLNPLVPLHLVAGVHNDALMLGLLTLGLFVAFGRSRYRFAVAAVLVTLAALIKAPAAAALLVVAARWRSIWLTGTVAAATTIAVTHSAGTGYGWIASLTTPIHKHSWSLSSALGRLTRPLLGEASMRLWLWLGLAALATVAVLLLRHHRRLGAVYSLGLGLAALAVLGPVTRPWYVLWGVVPIAVAATSPAVRRWCAIGCAALGLLVLPSGFGPSEPVQVAVAGYGVALGLLVWLALSGGPALPGRGRRPGYRPLWTALGQRVRPPLTPAGSGLPPRPGG